MGAGRVSAAAATSASAVGQAAATPPEMRGLARDEVRLLVSRGRAHGHAVFSDLPDLLEPGTLIVVNTSATLPASLPASGRPGRFILNLSNQYRPRLWLAEPRWDAGRPGPLPIAAGEAFEAAGVGARFLAAYPGLARLWFVAFDEPIESAMAAEGRPIRYGYVAPPWPPLAAYQTVFADVPGSAEMPSAARPFTPRLIAALAERDIEIAAVELHTGVSSLDGEGGGLHPEAFRVTASAATAVNRARRRRRPVIAVGTTVVRALESAWDGHEVRPSEGFTRLFVHPGHPASTIDGLITGFHDPTASHLAMIEAVAGRPAVIEAYRVAVRAGYLWHEFGDSHLILPPAGRD
jgi:S-adenosylmethionine:tRNA ribosyltransferase-isomerase